jgi:hypothetical protein
MDEDGNAMFACVDNLAIRARVTVEQAEAAVRAFEAPDPKSGDPDNDGRRIERFPGGWHVLNAHKYRAMVTKTIIREQTRVRTARWRAKQSVTQSDAHVTHSNENVTPSEAVSEAVSEASARAESEKMVATQPVGLKPDLGPVGRVFEHWKQVHKHPKARLDAKRKRVIEQALKLHPEADLCLSITGYLNSAHHMGQNDRSAVYDDIELFLRDTKHIEAGLRFVEAAPAHNGLSSLTKRNVAATENWVPPEMRNAAK